MRWISALAALLRPPTVLTVTVTAEDIANGVTLDPLECPVARAIARALPSSDYVSVGLTNVYVKRMLVDLPPSVVDWIARFDQGETVEPMTFRLVMPR